jgi:hypothetical protein
VSGYEDDYWDDDLDDEEISATDLVEMLKGSYGEEAQAAAFELTGYEPVSQGGEPSEDAREFTAQAIRKERDLGRPLTAKEIDALATDQAGTGLPDVSEAYDRINGRTLSNDEDRRAIAVEYMQETDAAQTPKRQERQDRQKGPNERQVGKQREAGIARVSARPSGVNAHGHRRQAATRLRRGRGREGVALLG